MSLTPTEQAEIDRAAEDYEARQERLRTEREQPDRRFTREHAAWRAQHAKLAAQVVGLRVGDVARRLLVGGAWHDGQFVLALNSEVAGDSVMWWVDSWTRGVIPHGVVQGWQIAEEADDRFAEMRTLRLAEPAPDCETSGNALGTEDQPYIGRSEDRPAVFYCPSCERTIPVLPPAGDGEPETVAPHDTQGRVLPTA